MPKKTTKKLREEVSPSSAAKIARATAARACLEPLREWRVPSDPDVRREILDLIEEVGCDATTAANACQINRNTWKSWREKHPEFEDEVAAAFCRWQITMRRSIQNDPSKATPCMMLLERTMPADYSRPADRLLYQASVESTPEDFRLTLTESMIEMRRRFTGEIELKGRAIKDAKFRVTKSEPKKSGESE